MVGLHGVPVPVTEDWLGTSAEQAVNTPNDEERLEQMSHPKNQGDGTDDAPSKGGMDLLGSGYGKVLLVVVVFSGHSVPPNAFDSSSCCPAWVTQPLPFLP